MVLLPSAEPPFQCSAPEYPIGLRMRDGVSMITVLLSKRALLLFCSASGLSRLTIAERYRARIEEAAIQKYSRTGADNGILRVDPEDVESS